MDYLESMMPIFSLFTQAEFVNSWEFGYVCSKANSRLEYLGFYKKIIAKE